MYFEYHDNNDIIKNKNGRIIFSNYERDTCPVPFNRNLQNKLKPENTIELGIDNNLYEIEYYHSGYIIEINAL